MAGSKTFLQPILDETVGGIQTAVNDVVEVVEPIPDKIDSQIDELETVVDKLVEVETAITNSTLALKSKTGTTNTINFYLPKAISGTISAGAYKRLFTISSNLSGIVNLNITNGSCTNSAFNLYYSLDGGTTKVDTEVELVSGATAQANIVLEGGKSCLIYVYNKSSISCALTIGLAKVQSIKFDYVTDIQSEPIVIG